MFILAIHGIYRAMLMLALGTGCMNKYASILLNDMQCIYALGE